MKSFLFKLFVFLLILFGLQAVIFIVRSPSVPEGVTQLKTHLAQGVDVIGLGDSSVLFAYDKESNQDPTYTLLQGIMNQHRIGAIAHPAYHMGIYEAYFENIVKNSHSVDLVIIPLNLRSFSPESDQRPDYEFSESKLLLRHDGWLTRMFLRPLSVFKLFAPQITERDYHNKPVYFGDQRVGQVKDFLSDKYFVTKSRDEVKKGAPRKFIKVSIPFYRDKFIFHYMYALKEDHRKMASIRRIIRMSHQAQIPVIFYITPIDVETGTHLLGKRFKEQVAQNAKVLQEVVQQEGGVVMDLSATLGKDFFYWYDDEKGEFTPSEHLRYPGRAYVAKRLFGLITQK